MKIVQALAILSLWSTPLLAERLPTTVVPEHYTLWFAPDLQRETFRGRETIRVQVRSPSASITLNAAEIDFDRVSVTAAGRTQSARVTTTPAAETATFELPQAVPAGPATIEIAYTGILNRKLRGFYISTANNRKYAVTQMEATDARRAFPSFDEPAYKATFDVSLMIDEGDTAISNGRQVSDRPGPEPGTHTVTFSRSPKMSTYLVAMLVGDFACREASRPGLPIRVCSTPDKLPLTAFALEAAQQEVRFFNNYFGIEYPWEKLDIIGVPDFAAGAMENVGAITFRERMLLVDPQRASLDTRKMVAAVIAHELAHQWFGDLVTMKWWDDIWLNEGFATWMANKPLAAWKPEWSVAQDDATATLGALSLDSLDSTRAIRTKAETAAEINQLFDGIAYEKTAAVLRMVEHYVGPENMRRAVSSYLRKYSYSNAAGEDFWSEVTRVTGKPVDRIMTSFVDQPGAPLLSIGQICSGGNTEITVTQSRFMGRPGASPASPSQSWTVPACFKTSATGAPRCEVIDRPAQTFTARGCGPVFANAGGNGYYVTQYSPDAVRDLTAEAPALAPVERIRLLGDERWMMRSGRHDVDLYLDLAAALAGDRNDAVTSTVASGIEYIGTSLVDPSEQPRYQEWVRTRFGPALDILGLPGNTGESEVVQNRRATLLMLVGHVGNDTRVQRQARDLAHQYLADPSSVPPTLAPAVLQVAALGGDRALYDTLASQLPTLASRPEEYYRVFNALTWFRDPDLVQRTLEFAMTPSVRTQDLSLLLAALLAQPWSREQTWTFVKNHWSGLTDKLGVFQGIPALIGSLGSYCSTDRASEVRQFFDANRVPSSTRLLKQSLERIDDCAAVRGRQAEPLSRWLARVR